MGFAQFICGGIDVEKSKTDERFLLLSIFIDVDETSNFIHFPKLLKATCAEINFP